MFDLIFAGALLVIVLGSFTISLAPYITLYMQQGYSRKDAFLRVLNDFFR